MLRSKKTLVTIQLSARDAAALELMLKLHRHECEKQAGDIHQLLCRPHGPAEGERLARSHRSWQRSGRKAKFFAVQLHTARINAENGCNTPVRIQ